MKKSNDPSLVLPLKLGQLMSTPGAIRALVNCGVDPLELIERHRRGDWGDVNAEDKRSNDEALLAAARILSVYTIAEGIKLWLITEADRSVTTILLPSEY